MAGGLQRVDRLARLRDGEGERVGAEDRVAVPELARDLDLDGQTGPVLDRVLRDQPRVEGGAARDHEDLVDLAEDVVADPCSSSSASRRSSTRPTSVSRIAAGCSSISLRMKMS